MYSGPRGDYREGVPARRRVSATAPVSRSSGTLGTRLIRCAQCKIAVELRAGEEAYAELYRNSVDVPGRPCGRCSRRRGKHSVAVVMGVNERGFDWHAVQLYGIHR